MKRLSYFLIISLSLAFCSCGRGPYDRDGFLLPDISWRPTPLWFWNNCEVTSEGVETELRDMIEKDGYGGCSILAFGGGFKPAYLSEEYFKVYAKAVEVASSYGAKMSLYDEYGFPSGGMGACNGDGVNRFEDKYPEHCLKRLGKHESGTVSGQHIEMDLNGDGTRMATAALDKGNGAVIALGGFVRDGILEWDVPAEGDWTIINFFLEPDIEPFVDYLSPDAVKLFVNEVHEKYYGLFGSAFGSVITSTFFDEPTMYRCDGRPWTEGFNERFESEYGCSPEPFYPALWYEIGDSTAAARNMMFGMRARIYSEGFMKVISDWAGSHGILSTGHQDQEEVVNPVSVSGDLMLCCKHMSMPGIDKIGGNRPAENFYKVISSAANNWDKPYVMSETYGAMGNIPVSELYSIAIEQYTKGITNLIPHAVWYDDSNVTFLPELSGRNPLYRDSLPDFNRFLSRLNYILARPGRHVADIAVLYPIHTMQAGHYLDGPESYYNGGVRIPGCDYDLVSSILTDDIGADFTYIHPEVLDDRCSVSEGHLVMENELNRESFTTIILPGVSVISASNMERIHEAWKDGVKVVFTTQTPSRCADFEGDDETIASMVDEMLSSTDNPAMFVNDPSGKALREALDGTAYGVAFNGPGLNNIHKIVEGHDVYFFGNIGDEEIETDVIIDCADRKYLLMDPHTGHTVSVRMHGTKDGRRSLHMRLAPSRSLFLVSR